MGERISLLVNFKAYPAVSEKYGEVVCVAGIRTDTEHGGLFTPAAHRPPTSRWSVTRSSDASTKRDSPKA
jgi:hypothetical protein